MIYNPKLPLHINISGYFSKKYSPNKYNNKNNNDIFSFNNKKNPNMKNY